MRPLTIEKAEQYVRIAIDDDDAAAIEHWGKQLDELEERERRQPPSLLAAAQWYASIGLPIFPLKPMSKMPYGGSKGVLDATTDVEKITRWWSRHDSNIGIATGHVVDVVDVDGLAGNIELSHLLAELPHALDKCIGICSTPRAGGRHFYFKARGQLGNGAKLMPSIDYRGKGGYVVAPPSMTELGSYSWTRLLDV